MHAPLLFQYIDIVYRIYTESVDTAWWQYDRIQDEGNSQLGSYLGPSSLTVVALADGSGQDGHGNQMDSKHFMHQDQSVAPA